jgi:hypothetical protein
MVEERLSLSARKGAAAIGYGFRSSGEDDGGIDALAILVRAAIREVKTR